MIASAPSAAPNPSTSIPHPLGNVLLAEDDLELTDLLSCFLRRRGYRVFSVRDGASLSRRVSDAAPEGPLPVIDVIVSDVYMPGMDGLVALDQLRKQGHRIPTILMTAFGSDEMHARGCQLGAALVLDKPFDLEDLLRAVDDARFGRHE